MSAFSSILACLTCAKSFQEAGGNAAGLAILLMLVVIVGVAGYIAFALIRMARRESENLEPQYRDTPAGDSSLSS